MKPINLYFHRETFEKALKVNLAVSYQDHGIGTQSGIKGGHNTAAVGKPCHDWDMRSSCESFSSSLLNIGRNEF